MLSRIPTIPKAFTLLELMIVVTIMALLAAFGIPSYLSYIQRASVTEGVSVLGDYKKSLAIFWSVEQRLPTTGDILPGTPAPLPFGTIVTDNLPSTIQSLQLTGSGNGVLISAILQSSALSTFAVNNRTLSLGALPEGNEIQFQCGNFTANAATISDVGFVQTNILPKSCNYNGIGPWLSS
jgi:prepilin-type N-terminal cleavage/methylation domain-containing protein